MVADGRSAARSRGAEIDPESEVDSSREGPVGDPLIVLGMHRSGTSALAGALSLLGVEFGEPLMTRDGENLRGYFEHLDIYDFHQRLLEMLGWSWDDLRTPRLEPDADFLFDEVRDELADLLQRHFAGSPLWAAKDPRVCRFVPVWDAALTELGCTPRYLIVFRHPDEVAASLGRRDRFSRNKSDLLWADHYLAAEAATRGAKRAFISYAELLRSPESELTRIADELGLDWPTQAVTARDELQEFLSKRLRHHVAAESALEPRGRLGAMVPSLWQALEAALAGTLDPELCDSLRSELAGIQESFDPVLVEHFSQLTVRGELKNRVVELERLLTEHTEWMRGSLGALEERLDEHARWMDVQDRALEGQREMLWSLEKLIGERTRWLQIQDEILHRQIARIDELEGRRESVSEDEVDEEPERQED